MHYFFFVKRKIKIISCLKFENTFRFLDQILTALFLFCLSYKKEKKKDNIDYYK